MINVCFVSFNSYPLFRTNHPGYFGGAELQISLIAKKLVQDKRFNINVVVTDYGQKALVKTNKIALYLAFRKQRSFIWETIRFFWLLKKINADVYVERTLNLKVGLVGLFCKLFKKKFVYMVAHNWDAQLNHGYYLKGISKLSFDYGLKHADLIIAQTQNQKKQLKNNFGLESIVMRALAKIQPYHQKKTFSWFLWVGRADKWKRPEKFIQLAENLPKEKFVMICRQGNDRRFYYKIKNKAQKQINLKFLKIVSYEQIIKYFQQAKIFVNTSVAEGFPNTFMQAGISKTPIVSLQVNPDGFITDYNCGFWAKNNFSKLVKDCQTLIKDNKLTRRFGNNNYRYVNKFHSLENVRLLTNILLNNFGRPAA